jgi:hypothetical protein
MGADIKLNSNDEAEWSLGDEKGMQFNFMPPTSRGRRARRCRVTFAVFAQFSCFHTMRV